MARKDRKMTTTEIGLNHAAAAWGAAMARASLQGGVALAIAWCICWMFPRLNAGVRCWLLRLAYVKLFVALFIATPIDIPLLRRTAVPMASPILARQSAVVSPAAVGEVRQVTSNLPGTAAEPTKLKPEVWLLGIWLAAVCMGLRQLHRSSRTAKQLRSGAQPLDGQDVIAECDLLCKVMGIRRRPPTLLIEGPYTALAQGAVRPAILFGNGLWNDAAIDAAERRLILAHEMAHLARRDLIWNWLPVMARTLFVFHPLVWLAEREWNQILEMACDTHVLHTVRPPVREYGTTLLKAAAHIKLSNQCHESALAVIESYESLQRRLESMKTSHILSRRSALFASFCLIATGALFLIPWRLTAAERSKNVVLLDHSKGHTEKDVPSGFVYDQEQDDFPGSSTYTLAEVVVPDTGWLVDSITVYFVAPPAEKLNPQQGHSVPHADGWLKVNKGRLNIFSKTGSVPAAADDPSKGEVVALTQKALKDGVYAITVSGLNRKLTPGKYWVGLTPMYNWVRNGQAFHVLTVDQRKGDEGVMRNPAGGEHFTAEDENAWKPISQLFGGASRDEEPAIKIEGLPINKKGEAG